MKKNPIISLTSLKIGSVITAVSKADNKYTFIVHNIAPLTLGTGKVELKLIEINEHFTTWTMTLPFDCNEESRFISKNDSSYDFQFFTTKHTSKELSKVLIKYLKSKQPQKK